MDLEYGQVDVESSGGQVNVSGVSFCVQEQSTKVIL